jgi:hypothetical protein
MKVSKILLGLAAALSLTATAGLAHASTTPCATFETVGTDLDVIYSPFLPVQTVRPFLIRVTRNDPTATSVRFILLDTTHSPAGNPRIGAAGPIGYDIQWLGNTGQHVFFDGNRQVDQTNGATVSFGSGPIGGLRTASFIMTIPAGKPVAASRQIENLEVSFQCFAGSTPIGVPGDQVGNQLQVDLTVIPYFGAYIGSAGTNAGRIDFGPIDMHGGNPTGHVAVTSMSTLPYDVRIQTDRHSVLRLSDSAPDGIPYTMRFAGVQATDGSTLRCPTPPIPSGATQNLDVTLDNSHSQALQAGHYTDTITVTFTPRDGGAAPSGGCVQRQ